MDAWKAIEELALGGLRGDAKIARRLLDDAASGLLVRALRHRRLQWIERESLRIEAAQDCLCRVWERRREYRGTTIAEFYGWFNRICDTRAADIGRRLLRGREDTLELNIESEQTLTIRYEDANAGLDPETRVALEDCLETLLGDDPDAYDVVVLIYYLGVRVDVVQEILVRARSTIYEQRKRAQLALAECLDTKGVP